MIKNFKTYTLLIISLCFFACSDDNDVAPLFDSDIDARVAAQIDNYKKALVSSEFGWVVKYQPKNSAGIYNVHLDFNDDDSVEITSDYKNGESDLKTSYRVDIGHFPELVFENYTFFHELFLAQGFITEAEFEFIFDDISDNQIVFRSKTDRGENPTKITFEKATQNDKNLIDSFKTFYNSLETESTTNRILRNFVVLDAQNNILLNSTFSFADAERQGVITTFDTEKGSISSTSHRIEILENGFELIDPFIFNEEEIKAFVLNDDGTYTSTDGNMTSIIGYNLAPITTALVPSLFSEDVDAFRVNHRRYVYNDKSSNFFLPQTSDDFLNLGVASSLNQIVIVFDDPNAGGLSYFVFPHINGSVSFLVFNPVVISGERIVFQLDFISGDISDHITMANLLLDPNGFYINRTNETNASYSLINVSIPNFRFSVHGL